MSAKKKRITFPSFTRFYESIPIKSLKIQLVNPFECSLNIHILRVPGLAHVCFVQKSRTLSKNGRAIAVLDNLEALEAEDVTKKVIFEAKKWPPIVYGVCNPIHILGFRDKFLYNNILRFIPI